jgi:hypothetical protein
MSGTWVCRGFFNRPRMVFMADYMGGKEFIRLWTCILLIHATAAFMEPHPPGAPSWDSRKRVIGLTVSEGMSKTPCGIDLALSRA